MQIIFVEENQKDKWDEFIASNPNGSFLQSWAWGDFQKSFGRKVWRLAVMENNEIVSAALIIKHSLLFGWNYFYCPRPVVKNSAYGGSAVGGNEQRTKNRSLFFGEIRKLAGKEKAVFLRVDPIENPPQSPFKKGEEFNSPFAKACPILDTGGVRRIFYSTKPIQPQHTLILDITKSEDEILSRMKQKTRYNIRLAERKGVKIKKISQPNDQEIQTFLNLSIQTSKRDKFQIHPKEYYQKMLKILCVNSMAELFLAEYQNKIIAANIVIFFSGKAIYLHGASSSNHREAMAPYLLHWEQIKEAKKLGCKSYDFWGIAPTDTKCLYLTRHLVSVGAWAGITRFKKGFGGEEISYPESWDFVFRPLLYKIYKVARKIL